MRITSSTYPEMFKAQVQDLLAKQLALQTQVNTGLKIQQASDDPGAYHQTQALMAKQAELKTYMSNSEAARSLGETNYAAMTNLQRLVTRANELAMRGTGGKTAEELGILGEEISSIMDQVVQLANQKYDGRYLFGGTKNVPPVVETAAGPPSTYEYNNAPLSAAPNTPDGALAADYTSNVTTAEIAEDVIVDTGLVAGRSQTDDPVGGAVERASFDGFLYNSNVDVLDTLQDIRNALLAGTEVTAAQLADMNDAVNLAAEFVGKTAGRLATLDLNDASLTTQIKNGVTRITDKTSVSLADAITDLSKVQLNYQAALQSGAQILQMSLLNYI
ncbi:MAG: hypothetical protein ACOY3I_00710 [Verrucomicrobiota bacterium]